MRRRLATVAFLALGLPAAAFAQAAAPCPAAPVAVSGLDGWASRTLMGAGVGTGTLPTIDVGKGADVVLVASPKVRFALAPEKAPVAASFGGLLGFTVARQGIYRVALGGGAWIDVLSAGKPVAATAHGHGPECSGVRKMVDFTLVPGRYVLQLSGSMAAKLPVMVARLP